MHLEVLVSAVAEELGATGAEICETGDILLGRQSGGLMEMDRRHLLLLKGFAPLRCKMGRL
jgi:hypothetical protein